MSAFLLYYKHYLDMLGGESSAGQVRDLREQKEPYTTPLLVDTQRNPATAQWQVFTHLYSMGVWELSQRLSRLLPAQVLPHALQRV